VAVADDLAVAVAVAAVPTLVDPIGHLGFDGLDQELLGSGPKDFGEHVGGTGEWHDAQFVRRVNHSGVLLGLVGPLVNSDIPRVRRLSSSCYPQHSIIPPGVLSSVLETCKWRTIDVVHYFSNALCGVVGTLFTSPTGQR
jgi:hypothetical protein